MDLKQIIQQSLQLRIKAKAIHKLFSWDKSAEKIYNILREIADK